MEGLGAPGRAARPGLGADVRIDAVSPLRLRQPTSGRRPSRRRRPDAMDRPTRIERVAVDLGTIFKAYDVRGVYPDEFDDDAAYRIGRAFARWIRAEKIVLGRDCRLSSPALSEAFVHGVVTSGLGIVDIGLATTDMVYFASGQLSLPGAMFTASHNPPHYNGLKLCRPGAAPVGEETGLRDVRDLAAGLNGASAATAAVGTVERRDPLEDYLEHLLSFAGV